MFNRSQGKQGKQQGFAKEQRIADAQLASLKQLGLIGRDKKGFASAWGGTEPITTASGSGSAARTGPNYTSIKPPGDSDGPSFPEKGELSFTSLSVFLKPFPSHNQGGLPHCTLLSESHRSRLQHPFSPFSLARCARAHAVVLPPAPRPLGTVTRSGQLSKANPPFPCPQAIPSPLGLYDRPRTVPPARLAQSDPAKALCERTQPPTLA